MGIIPAYAGSTVKLDSVCAVLADHPRLRGEHTPGRLRLRLLMGSSPLTRGALGAAAPRDLKDGIIPAYAGSTTLRAPLA